MNYYRSGQITQEFMTFFVLVGCVAALVFLSVRGLGLPVKPPPSPNGPLVIRLVPEETHCVSRLPVRGSGSLTRYNEEGEIFRTGYIEGAWFGVANYTMGWQVAGGEEPYEIEIDGERTNAFGARYTSPRGQALLGCVLKGGAFLWDGAPANPSRVYHSIPKVEPKWKTVKATVRDADGRTAEAEAFVYVVVDLDDSYLVTHPVLRKGRTYLYQGRLLTAPAEYDIRLSEASTGGPSVSYSFTEINAGVWLLEADYRELSRWHRGASADDPDTVARVEHALDQFVESVDKLPQLNPSPPSPSSTFADGDH